MPPKRRTIPKALKQQVWDKYMGREKGISKCYCCEINEISKGSFHAGHVIAVANGGGDTIDNLRPVCASCNLSMRTKNLEEYKDEHYRPSMDLDEPEPEPKPKRAKKPKTMTPEQKAEEYISKKTSFSDVYKDMFHEYCHPLSDYPIMMVDGKPLRCKCGRTQMEIENESIERLKEKKLNTEFYRLRPIQKMIDKPKIKIPREEVLEDIIDNHLIHYFQ